MRKAALYDQTKARRKGLKPVTRTGMKAGSKSGDPREISNSKASKRLKKSGSIDDAASVYYNMIRSFCQVIRRESMQSLYFHPDANSSCRVPVTLPALRLS